MAGWTIVRENHDINLRGRFQVFGSEIGLSHTNCPFAERVHAMITAIDAGMGLGVVPEYLVEKKLQSGELVKITLQKAGQRTDLVNRIGMTTLMDRQFSNTEKTFIEYCSTNLK